MPPPSPQSETSAASAELPKKRTKTTTSPVWDHYIVSWEKGVKMVKCKCCQVTYKNPSGTSTLTAHMSKHPLQLKPKPKPPIPAWCQQTSAEVSKISTQKQAEATGLLKKWIACSAKPFSTVEDPYFVAYSKSLNPAYK
ncbi:hypothetical protein RvY_19382, partial [Ramazzottius varieornatus]